MTQSSEAEQIVVLRPAGRWTELRLGELWRHNELLFFLAWRDVKVRYKQTALGAAWAILQPALAMIIFTVIFGRLAKMPSGGIPYPAFAFAGLVPWQLFSYALTESGNSVVSNRNLITKVYFPRLVIPLSPVLAGLLDFSIAFIGVLVLMAFYGLAPSWRILALPVFVVMTVATAVAAGLWLSALNARYRDVRYAIPFLTQFWLYATPIAYPSSLVPERWRPFVGLNPMAGVVEGFRWSLFGGTPPGPLVGVSAVVVAILLVSGLYYFRRMEAIFADVV